MSSPTENVYCFISGKNWKLSLAELTTYLDAHGCGFEVLEFSRSFFTLQTQTPIGASVIDDLGGTLKIAKIAGFVPTKRVTDAFLEENKQVKKQLKFDFPFDALADQMPRASSGKAVFGVSVYWADPFFKPAGRLAQRFVGSALKDELKEQDKKARFMGFPHDRSNPQLTPVEVIKQGLLENHAEILLCIGTQQTSIGTTIAVHNPFEFQKRDLDKPVQRKIFGISPRVAKLLLNLTKCTPGKVFLDPFCGVGNILLEALLAKARVIGVDINRWCVDASKRNLQWVTQEYELRDVDYAVVQGDARDLRRKVGDEVDCIATEPDLGPALREVPTEAYAEKIIRSQTPLFEDFLSSAYGVLRRGGYLALVTPYIRTRSGKFVSMGIGKLAEEVGFETVTPFADVAFVGEAADFPLHELASFVDVDERHKIGREISIFHKTK
jgi:tRNA G10  N-methylase Trm11